MDKVRVRDFDPTVCMGQHPDYDGPCPHLEANDADTGHGVVDRLRRLETSALNAITDVQDGACGMCGCPLVNLGALDFAPGNCPRLEGHGGRAGE